MNDRMRKGCCRLLTLLLTLVLVIPAYGQETLDALAAAQGCTAETLLQSDKLTAGDSVSDWMAIAVSRAGTEGDTSAYRKALERYVTRMYREQGGLDRLRATEWQRTVLTALALGADPTAFGRDKNTPQRLLHSGRDPVPLRRAGRSQTDSPHRHHTFWSAPPPR